MTTDVGCLMEQALTWSLPTVACDDSELARAAARGDEAAFVRLVSRHRRFIYNLAYRVVLSSEDALDVTQTVMLRLVEKIGKYDGRGAFRSWLATMVTREAINHLRRPSRREDVVDPEYLAEMCAEGQVAGEEARGAVLSEQRMAAIQRAMVHLSPQQRAIMALRLFSELGPKEIGEQLGLPARQVRSQIHRAVERLRRLLRGKL
ncbi:sigma-70 family RNA polymerase sigma factor [bacterium]|nr:sigma-70 family RNA polymerase sigma factor [bacterium]